MSGVKETSGAIMTAIAALDETTVVAVESSAETVNAASEETTVAAVESSEETVVAVVVAISMETATAARDERIAEAVAISTVTAIVTPKGPMLLTDREVSTPKDTQAVKRRGKSIIEGESVTWSSLEQALAPSGPQPEDVAEERPASDRSR